MVAGGQGAGEGGEGKRCNHCQVVKPLTEFNSRTSSKDGLRASCRSCDKLTRHRAEGAPDTKFRPRHRQPEFVSGGGAESGGGGGGNSGGDTETDPTPTPDLGSTTDLDPTTTPTPEAASKVIGRIGGQDLRARAEVALDPLEEEAKKLADEYATLLNRKMPIRVRAHLMVKIAKNIRGGNAALALKALQDINLATRVTNRSGAQIDLGPLFVLPEGSDVSMGGGGTK